MSTENIQDIYNLLKRDLKAGNIIVTTRTNMDEKEVLEDELMLSYESRSDIPILKVRRNGEIVPIFTDSDVILNELLQNILKIGTNSEDSGYSPSIYYTVAKSATGLGEGKLDNTFVTTDEHIHELFDEVAKLGNKLIPYINHSTIKGENYRLLPYMDGSHVYINLIDIVKEIRKEFTADENGKLVDRSIVTMTDMFKYAYQKIEATKMFLATAIADLDGKLNQYIADTSDIHKDLSNKATAVGLLADANMKAVNDMRDEVNVILSSVEKTFRPIRFRTAVQPEGMDVATVLISAAVAGVVMPNGEFFITEALTGIQTVQIGHGVASTNNTGAIKPTSWKFFQTHPCPDTFIYGVNLNNRFDNDNISFEVYLKGDTEYILYSRYVDSVEISTVLSGNHPTGSVLVNGVNGYLPAVSVSSGPEDIKKISNYSYTYYSGITAVRSITFGREGYTMFIDDNIDSSKTISEGGEV